MNLQMLDLFITDVYDCLKNTLIGTVHVYKEDDYIDFTVKLEKGKCYSETVSFNDIVSFNYDADKFCNMYLNRIKDDYLRDVFK